MIISYHVVAVKLSAMSVFTPTRQTGDSPIYSHMGSYG